ncbi:hypothetical protein HDN73_001589 [Staphylococcus pseudintermedius]|nr:hypothetical protein [Staphylococcus pseudintermedius]
MSYVVGISFTILILLTGRSFLVLSLFYFIIVIILPVRISTMLLLYIGLTVLDLIVMYILLKLEVIE